jgi:hypothetical protein
VGPLFQAFPDFLKKNNYQDIMNNANTVHQTAWNSEGPVFTWIAQHPQNAAWFNEFMAHRRNNLATWLDVYPIEKQTKRWDPKDVVFVDIGGNTGHQCAELKAKYPNLPGRIILQDLPHAITMTLQPPSVENTIHDIVHPQPIKGQRCLP